MESVVYEFRIMKYAPAFRDATGAYTRDEWTSLSDIGRSFGGIPLTREEYQRVENAYVTVATAFFREARASTFVVRDLENHRSADPPVAEGDVLEPEKLSEAARHVLRDEFWCRFEGADAFLHIGHDYYMYLGVPRTCPEAETAARRLGLFVEPSPSPYRRQHP